MNISDEELAQWRADALESSEDMAQYRDFIDVDSDARVLALLDMVAELRAERAAVEALLPSGVQWTTSDGYNYTLTGLTVSVDALRAVLTRPTPHDERR